MAGGVYVMYDDGAGIEVFTFSKSLDVLPAARLDPREPEPAAMVAPREWKPGDRARVKWCVPGQRTWTGVRGPEGSRVALEVGDEVTVNGLQSRPTERDDLVWISTPRAYGPLRIDACLLEPIPAKPDAGHGRRGFGEPTVPPWTSAIASGAALWQQADATNRHAFVHLFGHVVTVTAGRSPTADAFTAKFLGPMRAEAVPAAIDMAIANGDHEPLRLGGSDTLALIDGEVA